MSSYATLVDINFDKTLFCPFTVSINKCGGGCNTIEDPYAEVCVPNKVKNINAKVFNLVSIVYKTRFLVQNESCEWKCRLNESVYNSKLKWNRDECMCECNKLNNWGSYEKDYMWNPSMCDCECNRARKYDKYLDIKNWSFEKH